VPAKHFHVVEGCPWKDALIAFLEPESPYRPWCTDAGMPLREGDVVIAVLDTEPRTVLGAATLGADLDVARALSAEPWRFTHLREVREVESTTGESLAESLLDDAAGERVVRALDEYDGTGLDWADASSAVAAEVLLTSGGICMGCDQDLPLRGESARDRFNVRLARGENGEHVFRSYEWPATICADCLTALRAGGFRNFVDFRLSRHPACPSCDAHRTYGVEYGLPRPGYYKTKPPWTWNMGCLVTQTRWLCGQCRHEW
jgi:hypothetical protein